MKVKVILPLILIVLSLSACIYDGPPKTIDIPPVENYNGKFVSDYGTMIFNGDGKTVEVDFTEDLLKIINLPAGKQEATYRFVANTPPHKYDTQWDRASDFIVTIGDQYYNFGVMMGHMSESKIDLIIYLEKGFIEMVFVKD